MENKINIAQLLKDCPQGMELDCVLYDDVTLECVSNDNCYPIKIHTPEYNILLNKYGGLSPSRHAKCVIFPKGKTSWEGFVSPREFKDGDVVVAEGKSFQLFLLKHVKYREDDNDYDGYCYFGWDFLDNRLFEEGNWGFNRLATEEERQRLFQAIEEHGYKWNEETKTLEKLIEPKFKVGDKVKRKDVNYTYIITIAKLGGDYYDYVNEDGQCGVIHISKQDDWELVPNKFDISSLVPFESRVLIRSYEGYMWVPAFWGGILDRKQNRYLTTRGAYEYCIPYEGNEHLLGKTDDCSEFYKNW